MRTFHYLGPKNSLEASSNGQLNFEMWFDLFNEWFTSCNHLIHLPSMYWSAPYVLQNHSQRIFSFCNADRSSCFSLIWWTDLVGKSFWFFFIQLFSFRDLQSYLGWIQGLILMVLWVWVFPRLYFESIV